MKLNLATTGTVLAALVIASAVSSPAHAASHPIFAQCSTTGAAGSVKVHHFTGSTDKVKLTLVLRDTKADRRDVKIRFLSEDVNDRVTYWSWRKNAAGPGHSKSWTTTARNDRGIFNIGVQVGRFKGNRMLNKCTDWSL